MSEAVLLSLGSMIDPMDAFTEELKTAWRIQTFRARAGELRGLNNRHLLLGLLCTWLVGIGRWWEDPRAGLIQHLGIGSVVYVVVLTTFLWLILWPLNPPHWSYLKLLTFISLTSPPGLLYALPVRHGLDLDLAQTVRFWMLAIVAGWRVALLGYYLCRGAGLTIDRAVLGTLFPLIIIVFTLTALNLENVVMNIMGGVAEADRSVNDSAYGVLTAITLLSVIAFVPLVICYVGVIIVGINERLSAKRLVPGTAPR